MYTIGPVNYAPPVIAAFLISPLPLYLVSCQFFFFFLVPIFWPCLCCCVIVPGTLAFNLLYLLSMTLPLSSFFRSSSVSRLFPMRFDFELQVCIFRSQK